MNPRRLYRSRDRQLAGVAGGMAEYLDIDPTVVRILWIIAGIASAGFALLAYLVLALVIPQAPWAAPAGAPGGWASTGAGAATGWTAPPAAPASPAWEPQWTAGAAPRRRADSRGFGFAAIVGVVLIVFGAVALADAALPGWIAGAVLGPAVVLALGAALLVSSIRRREEEPAATPETAPTPPAPAPAAPWDVTDTQAVDPAAFGATGGPDQPGDPGSRPA